MPINSRTARALSSYGFTLHADGYYQRFDPRDGNNEHPDRWTWSESDSGFFRDRLIEGQWVRMPSVIATGRRRGVNRAGKFSISDLDDEFVWPERAVHFRCEVAIDDIARDIGEAEPEPVEFTRQGGTLYEPRSRT